MKKILGLSIAALLVIAMVAGGTFAYFQDTETSTGNSFTAGTLDLKLDGGDINVVKFTVTNANPGESGHNFWTLHNAGSLQGYLNLSGISVVDIENPTYGEFQDVTGTPFVSGSVTTTADTTHLDDSTKSWATGAWVGYTVVVAGRGSAVITANTATQLTFSPAITGLAVSDAYTLPSGELGANMDVVLFWDNGASGGTAGDGIQNGAEPAIYSGKLNAIAVSYSPDVALAGSATTYLGLSWSVATGVGNTIQGDISKLNITIKLNQIVSQP
jgi:predicted ribosomally synthesized peptide with SipW-like signal peptide